MHSSRAPATSMRRSTEMALLMLLLGGYLAISLRHLTSIPPVNGDEPWVASTGLKLAREGVFGSDLFAGFHGTERHYYVFMPGYPLLLAATYKVAGFGLLQTRLASVCLGMLVLILTYALGRRLYGPAVGLWAAALLLVVRLNGVTPYQTTGILLMDMARVARFDLPVPVFGLLSLHAGLSARRRASAGFWALAGLAAAVAGLSHVYGFAWIIVPMILLMAPLRDERSKDRGRFRMLIPLLGGFALPCLIYVVYVLTSFQDWVDQTRQYAPRFGLLRPSFYLENLLTEYKRYGPGLGPPGWNYLLRPGFWCYVLFLPASLLYLARETIRKRDESAAILLVGCLVFPVLFALVITSKVATYSIAFLPLFALAVSAAAVALWTWAKRQKQVPILVMLTAAAVLVSAEGFGRYVTLEKSAVGAMDYDAFTARLRVNVPPAARILALHNYWFGFQDQPYITWYVPLMLMDDRSGSPALTAQEALGAINPDVIIIDDHLRSYFATAQANDERPSRVLRWMANRGYSLKAVMIDPTYGRFEFYEVPPEGRSQPQSTGYNRLAKN